VIGFTLGDANGIGPEIAWKAAQLLSHEASCRFVLIGSPDALTPLKGYQELPTWSPDGGTPPESPISIWNPSPEKALTIHPGTIQADAATCAGEWIQAAIQACLNGSLDAMVTAPIHKAGFAKANILYPGHTEMLAEETNTTRYAMLLAGGPLRVLPATRHLAIRDVPDAITEELILEAIELLEEARPWLAIPNRPIAVCALNPHAGDEGAIGKEEIDIIRPALKKAEAKGHHIIGPVPADTVFHYAATGHYAAIICMYHDQGLAPLKMLAFDEGVNITLGLPIVRTSPDHGTAYDIAGQNKARPDSMISAVRTAIQLSQIPNPWAR
jgi:4-hydroxythreonine-4-phosphate dehydrogenase